MMPCSCAASNAPAICRAIGNASATESKKLRPSDCILHGFDGAGFIQVNRLHRQVGRAEETPSAPWKFTALVRQVQLQAHLRGQRPL
jgi:hypothetical protein